MEVHHHPNAEKKSFKEYFLEFVMIFLAVTLGFFAENFREHRVESRRENDLVAGLYSEILNDSAVVARKVALRVDKEREMLELRRYFQDSNLNILPKGFYPKFTKCFYLINIYAFEARDGVLNQLINPGGLRFIKNMELQRLLGSLSVSIRNMHQRNEQEYQFFADPIKHFLVRHFDFAWLDEVRMNKENMILLELMNSYESGTATIPAKILNVESFDRGKAANILSMYRQLLVSTRTLQMNDYVKTNHAILDVLRRNYPAVNEITVK